jgi:hypothetical protein
MNFRYKLLLFISFTAVSLCTAQHKAADSVVIRVGAESKVIFAIHDKADLETLKHYDFQALMSDMIVKLEKKDSTPNTKPSSEYLKPVSPDTLKKIVAADTTPAQDKEDWSYKPHHHKDRRTYQSFNFDIGTNNYLSNGKFPDQNNELYSVKPWGSWYVALNSIQRTRLGGKFFLEWGGGVSWYNFKYQDKTVAMSKDDNGVIFAKDARDLDFQKSKLTATYLNASIVPVLDFGGGSHHHGFTLHHNKSQAFRIGLGPYVGYRLDSYSKQMYREDGEKHKEHEHDNFYLNNIRYGMRLQLGFRDFDVFFNYDLNHLYVDNKGPQLNAFSFGVTF